MQHSNTARSQMLDQLYGVDYAQEIYDHLESIDPFINHFAQAIAYDQLWTLPPLSLRDKSLISIVSLAAINKMPQLAIHIRGFLNLNQQQPGPLSLLFDYMQERNYINQLPTELDNWKAIYKLQTSNTALELDSRDQLIADITASTAIGNPAQMEAIFGQAMTQQTTLSIDEVKGIIRHQIIYTGCPSAINALTVVKKLLETQNNTGDLAHAS